MRKRLLLLPLFLVLAAPVTFPQKPMVAWRVQGTWHYYDTDGKLMWKPYLDVAGGPCGWVGGLLLASALEAGIDGSGRAEIARRDVLYDAKGRIVYRPKVTYRYFIESGVDEAGYLLIRKYGEDALVVCDRAGNPVFECPETGSQYLGDGMMAFLSDDGARHVLWDLKAGRKTAEVPCGTFLGSFRNGAVLYEADGARMGLLLRDGSLALPMTWEEAFAPETGPDPMDAGFVCLKDPETGLWTLFTVAGKKVLAGIVEPGFLKAGFFQASVLTDDGESLRTYLLEGGEAIPVAEEYGLCLEPTQDGMLACRDEEGSVLLLDRDLRVLERRSSVEEVHVLPHAVWLRAEGSDAYDCYDAAGRKAGSLSCEELGEAAFGHVPFRRGGLWGLATEPGAVVIGPQFDFGDGEVPAPCDGFWEIREKQADGDPEIQFWNFRGEKALVTSSKKDGWDWMLLQESFGFFYMRY